MDEEEFLDEDELEDDFDEEHVEQVLHALYSPGLYGEGEELCIEILEEIDPDWEPAKLFLLLTLAAQDLEEEALEIIDELRDDSLFEALRLLAFGEGTEAEDVVYEDIILCAQERGLEDDMEAYLNNKDMPLERHEKTQLPEPWMRGKVTPSASRAVPAIPGQKGGEKVIQRVTRKLRRNRESQEPKN